MSNVVIVEDTDTEDHAAEVVDDIADAIDDAQSHAVDLDHAERLTRLEDGLALVATAVEGLTEQVSSLKFTDEMQEQEIQQVAEQTHEIAEGAAEAIQETVEEVEEATDKDSEGGSDITPDEIPSSKSHWFFRKWGKSS